MCISPFILRFIFSLIHGKDWVNTLKPSYLPKIYIRIVETRLNGVSDAVTADLSTVSPHACFYEILLSS